MTASHLQDIADVRALIQLYVEGSRTATATRCARHSIRWPTCSGTSATTCPPTNPSPTSTALVEANPGLHQTNYTWDIRTVDIVGDAGVAVLVETDYFGCDFVDYFTVCRIDGRWWITCKTYAHTGGTPPPM